MNDTTDPVVSAEDTAATEPAAKKNPFDNFFNPEDDIAKPKDGRSQVMDELAEKIRASRESEQGNLSPEDREMLKDQGLLLPESEEAQPKQETEETPAPVENEQAAKQPSASLDQFVEIVDDVPMMRFKVYGEDKLIPLSTVQADQQKYEAADIKWQKAIEFEEQSRAKVEAMQANQPAIQQSLERMSTTPTLTSNGDQGPSDDEIEAKAKSVMEKMFESTQDEAAVELAAFVKSIRGNTQTAPVDEQALTERIYATVNERRQKQENQTDIQRGMREFNSRYAEVAADPDMFAYADSLTETISNEHPTWTPSEIMLQAGSRAQALLDRTKKPSSQPQSDRQSIKDTLVPIPAATALAARSPVTQAPEAATPQSIVQEMRAARGQPN